MNIFDKLRQEALFSRSELAKDDAGTAAGDQCDEAEVTFFIKWDELGWDEIRWDGKWDFIRDWLRWLFIAWAWFYELWNFLIFREMDEKNMHNLFLKVSYLIKFDNQKWYTQLKMFILSSWCLILQNMAGLIEETKNPSPCLNPWVQKNLQYFLIYLTRETLTYLHRWTANIFDFRIMDCTYFNFTIRNIELN